MGSGKSTIGRQLATELGLTFVDCDRELETRTGADIPLIFELEGESGFRAREKRLIEELTALEGVVLATGGGAILDPDNRKHLSDRGFVIYLYCSPEQQHQRTARDKKRPLLQTVDPLGRLRELMEIRDPLYRATADLVITSQNRSVASVTRSIVKKLHAKGLHGGSPE